MKKALLLLLCALLALPFVSFAAAESTPSRVILVVSVGTSHNESRVLTIDAIAADIAAAYPARSRRS